MCIRDRFGGVVRYLLLLGAMIGLAALFQWAMTLCTNHITFHTVHSLRARMAEKLQRVPLKTIDNHAQDVYKRQDSLPAA